MNQEQGQRAMDELHDLFRSWTRQGMTTKDSINVAVSLIAQTVVVQDNQSAALATVISDLCDYYKLAQKGEG